MQRCEKQNNGPKIQGRRGRAPIRRYVALAGLFVHGLAIAALEPELAYFRLYGVEQGLSQNSVAAIHQDSDGFLWIGTQDGLNRFDGYDFVVFRRDSDDPASLASGDIAVLFEDAAGRLWVGTNGGGLNLLDRGTEQISRIAIDGTLAATDNITAICSHGEDEVWLGTDNGLARVSGFFGGAVAAMPDAIDVGALAAAEIAALACTGDDELWIATRRLGLYLLQGQRLEPFRLPAIAGTDGLRLSALQAGPAGELWVGTDGPVMYRIDAGGTVRGWRIPMGPGEIPRIRDLLIDTDGSVWLTGLGTGLLRFDAALEAFTDFAGSPDREAGLSDRDTYSLYLDRSGVLWVGTLSGGLNNLGLFSGGFERFRARPGTSQGLSHNMVTAFAEQQGRIWVGTDGGGLNRFDPADRAFEAFRHDPARTGAIADDRIWALLVDGEDTLWVGSWGGGLMRRTAGAGDFESWPGSPRNITALASAPNGDIWIGTPDRGLHRWRHDTDSFEPVTARLDDGSTLVATSVPDLHVAPGGSLWIATWGKGLLRLTPDGRLAQWRHRPGDESSIGSDTIRSITESADGGFWLGTAGGLTRFDPESGRVLANYGVEAGLPQSVIYAAVPDAFGRVWLSSNRGITRFDVDSESARSYDPRDGLQGFEFNGAAALAASDGYIYFGGTNGFNRFQPGELRDNPFPPAVALTDFLLFNEVQRPGAAGADSILDRALFATDSIVLDHTQDVIAMQFAALHFVSPERNRYAYLLDGFDRDWIVTDAGRRVAAYTNLDPGRYVFRVKAANSDGIWSADEATLGLEVLAPWWATRPALLGYVVAAVLLVSLFVRWRTLMLRRRAAELRKTVRDRTRLISEQKDTIAAQAEKVEQVLQAKEQLFARVSHEFRTPLTLILGSLDRLRGAAGEAATRPIGTIETSGRRLLRLVDQLLGLASLAEPQAGETAPRALHSIVSLAVNSFESLAESKRVGLRITRSDDAWVSAAPEALDQVVLNLLSNAIKFTPAGGRVDVALEVSGSRVRLSVADTGPGIDPERHERIFEPFEHGHVEGSGSGIGLALVREIVTSLGGEIALESSPGAGSRFVVILPACDAPAAPITSAKPASGRGAATEAVQLRRELDAAQKKEPEFAGAPAEASRPEVLVVEDNGELRRFLVETLGEHFNVAAAADGEAALPVARDELPDIIVSDVLMPRMDGFEFCRAIKTDERTSHIPVILLTAREDRESLMQGLEEGADEYLTKPFDAAALVLRVRNQLETRQMLRARLAATVDRSVQLGDEQVEDGATGPKLGRRDREFLEKLTAFLDKRHAESGLNVSDIADALALSERQLQRKLKALLNRSPSEHLRIYRLHRAAELLREGYPAGSVAADTGFSSASHFGACFKALFDATPGEYQKNAAPR